MTLLSNMDWLIIVAVGAFFLFGNRNEQALRQLGRYYGRLVRLKNEAMSEVTTGAGLPIAAAVGGKASVRQYLMADAFGSTSASSSGIPAAVTSPPQIVVRHTVEAYPYAASQGQWTWSVTAGPPTPEPPEAP